MAIRSSIQRNLGIAIQAQSSCSCRRVTCLPPQPVPWASELSSRMSVRVHYRIQNNFCFKRKKRTIVPFFVFATLKLPEIQEKSRQPSNPEKPESFKFHGWVVLKEPHGTLKTDRLLQLQVSVCSGAASLKLSSSQAISL